MAQFTTRVELHGAENDDKAYATLHTAMEAEGFSRTIKLPDGLYYHLPTAEYDRSGPLTITFVLESAKKAAAKTNKTFCVLVTEVAARITYNLKRV
jgi:HSP20 family molecular chaperone IbpA